MGVKEESLKSLKPIIVVSGPSGSGKRTYTSMLLEEFPNILCSISSTTRNPREDEIDGYHYNFISEEEFKKDIEEGNFIEWALVHNMYYYGTSLKQVNGALENNKCILIELNYEGYLQLLKKLDRSLIKSIFIEPFPREILADLIQKRSPLSEKELKNRLNSIEEEVKNSAHYDHILTPTYSDIEETYKNFKKLLFS